MTFSNHQLYANASQKTSGEQKLKTTRLDAYTQGIHKPA